MKALIIRPREGKAPTFQVVEFPGHDFNEDFGDLYKALNCDFVESVRKENVTAFVDEDGLNKRYTGWWCSPLRMKLVGPVALLSHCPEGNLKSFDNEEVLHSCRESGMEEWPSA